MAGKTKSRAETVFDYAVTAALLLGIVLFGRWFVGTVGGELDRGGLIVSLGLIVVSAAVKVLK